MSDKSNNTTSQAVQVSIYDHVYNLRGPNADYIRELAAMVDAKMRAVAAQGKAVDTLRVAVLAALNLADELKQMEEQKSVVPPAKTDAVQARADRINRMLDEILDERKLG
jgi:cell division protein ZapA